MRVDILGLKKIADQAKADRVAKEEAEKRQKLKKEKIRRNLADRKAKSIIESIPNELKKAAREAHRTKEGLVVTAKIPIVNEKMTSIMGSRGWLSSDDSLILTAVQERLKTAYIFRVQLSIVTETHYHTFISADGLDDATGPCTCYYIEAKTIIDN